MEVDVPSTSGASASNNVACVGAAGAAGRRLVGTAAIVSRSSGKRPAEASLAECGARGKHRVARLVDLTIDQNHPVDLTTAQKPGRSSTPGGGVDLT